MYFHILKRDLKRKKTMNGILFLFIILVSMFLSSSVNNITAIGTALNHYFDKSGIGNYFVVTRGGGTQEQIVEDILGRAEAVESYGREPIFFMNADNISLEIEQTIQLTTSIVLCDFETSHIVFFDKNNVPLTEVKDGEVYLSRSFLETNSLAVGDSITVIVGERQRTFTIAGGIKDALLGSDMMGMPRLVVDEDSFAYLTKEADEGYFGDIYYIETDNAGGLEPEIIGRSDINLIFQGDRAMLAMTYVMDMIVAGILLVVSICLILIALVVLRFTITFTLLSEYREIGIMKAIGIPNEKIRCLYLVKYLALAVLGSLTGLLLGVPFGRMLLENVSKTIVMETQGGIVLNVVCAAAVVLLILSFCFGCTRRVKKITPVDAVRNGQSGERYKKKSVLRLKRARVRPPEFMALNDCLGNGKRYGLMLLTFTICLSLIVIIINTINTLNDGSLIGAFSMQQSDVYLDNNQEAVSFITEDGRKKLMERMAEIEKQLVAEGMPAKCTMEMVFKLLLTNGEERCLSLAFQGNGTQTEGYSYLEGTPPAHEDEIALTGQVAKKLGAQIGDTVTVVLPDGERQCMITALYQSMNNMGEGIRLHEDMDINYAYAMGSFCYQLTFTDNPDKKEIEGRIDKISALFEERKVQDSGEYLRSMIGSAADYLEEVRGIVVLLVLIICIFVAVLMERSFLAKETGEIAILKAVGFADGALVRYHTARIAMVLLVSTVLTWLTQPWVSQISAGQVFKMMGMSYGVSFVIKPFDVFFLYPFLCVGGTLAAVWLTAQYIRKIDASKVSNIE